MSPAAMASLLLCAVLRLLLSAPWVLSLSSPKMRGEPEVRGVADRATPPSRSLLEL